MAVEQHLHRIEDGRDGLRLVDHDKGGVAGGRERLALPAERSGIGEQPGTLLRIGEIVAERGARHEFLEERGLAGLSRPKQDMDQGFFQILGESGRDPACILSAAFGRNQTLRMRV